MKPQEQFCPNPACGASGREGQIAVHSQKGQRYRCKQCQRTFTQTTGTAFYGLKQSHELFVLVVILLAYGCPVQAIVAAFGLDERTVWSWLKRSGQQAFQVHEQLVVQGELDLKQIQADELKVKTYWGTVWMGLVMM
jgi:transposase-like protein